MPLPPVDETRSQVEAAGRRCLTVRGDVSRAVEVAKLAAGIEPRPAPHQVLAVAFFTTSAVRSATRVSCALFSTYPKHVPT